MKISRRELQRYPFDTILRNFPPKPQKYENHQNSDTRTSWNWNRYSTIDLHPGNEASKMIEIHWNSLDVILHNFPRKPHKYKNHQNSDARTAGNRMGIQKIGSPLERSFRDD